MFFEGVIQKSNFIVFHLIRIILNLLILHLVLKLPY